MAPERVSGHLSRRGSRAHFRASFRGGPGASFRKISVLHPEHVSHSFYAMAPNWAIYPLVFLATLAAIIASQAVISGAFSLTYQAIRLGFMPRFFMKHLFDGDAASNTLSWRWVAGIQTQGKNYLARESNIRKFTCISI